MGGGWAGEVVGEMVGERHAKRRGEEGRMGLELRLPVAGPEASARSHMHLGTNGPDSEKLASCAW